MIESDLAQSRGDIMREIADLKREIRELRAERRLGASTIAAGGTLRVVDSNGTVVAMIGNLAEVAGEGQQGFWLGRPGLSTSQAISVFGTGEGGDLGFVGLWDRAGVYIVTDDAESGQGLARPYLSMTMGDFLTVPPTITSGTFVDVAVGLAAIHHPVLVANVLVYSSTGVTTGEAQLAINGTPVGTPISIAGGEFGSRDIGPFELGPARPAYDQLVGISVQARRTAGAGQIGVRVLSMLGLEGAYA